MAKCRAATIYHEKREPSMINAGISAAEALILVSPDSSSYKGAVGQAREGKGLIL